MNFNNLIDTLGDRSYLNIKGLAIIGLIGGLIITAVEFFEKNDSKQLNSHAINQLQWRLNKLKNLDDKKRINNYVDTSISGISDLMSDLTKIGVINRVKFDSAHSSFHSDMFDLSNGSDFYCLESDSGLFYLTTDNNYRIIKISR